MTDVHIRYRREDTDSGWVKMEVEIGVLQPEPRNAWGHQKLEETRKDSSPPEPPEPPEPSEGGRP